MRPTFMGFETARSSIFANQKALDIVGNNLANIDTNGYTRQRVETASISGSSRFARVASNRIGLAGQGVEALGVSQMRDSFLDKRFRNEYSTTSYHGKSADILEDIQSALGDGYDITSTSDLLSGIQQIWESIADFGKEPTSDTQANLIMSAFRNITQILQQLDTKLTGVTKQQTFDTGVDVSRVNDITKQISELNEKIAGDSTVLSDSDNQHYRPNELYDQRNLLLDELAGYGDIGITEMANGMVNVEMGGKKIVDGLSHEKLILQENKDQTISIKWQSSGGDIRLIGGSLKASMEFINGRGNNVQSSTESPQQGIPYYRDRINTFARELADLANKTIPEKSDINGNPVLYDDKGNALVDADGKSTVKLLTEDLMDTTDPANPVLLVAKGNYVDVSDPTKVVFSLQPDGTFRDMSAGSITKEPSETCNWLDANGNPALYDASGKRLVDTQNKPTMMVSDKDTYADKNGNTVNKGDYVDADGNVVYWKSAAGDWMDVSGNLATPPTTTAPQEFYTSGAPMLYDEKGNPLRDAANNPTVIEQTADGTDADGVAYKAGDYLDGDRKIAYSKDTDGTWHNKPGSKVVEEPKPKYKTLLSSGSGTDDFNNVTAGNISLSKAWNDGGAGYFISNKNQDASKFAKQLAVALTSQNHTFNSYGERFTGTYEDYVKDYVQKLGTDVKYQYGRQEATGKVADDFISRRDEISGVSRDEETANMLMYQKSYEAAARVMTTLDELLDVVINRMGRAGL